MGDLIYGSDDIARIEKMINQMEGNTFGKKLVFTSHSHRNELMLSWNGGWKQLEGFQEVGYMDEFAEEMNAATLPVRERFISRLKQDLVNKCATLSSKVIEHID